MKLKKLTKLAMASFATTMALAGCGAGEAETAARDEKPADAPDTWIANRTIKGLVFESAGDVGAEMNPEIQAYIKEKTGITLELEGITSEDSTEALASGLAAGDLPEFVAFYLNNSGRPEMQLLLKAANEGQFTDLAPYFEDTEVYSKYLEDGYLPVDTDKNIMFREDWEGASYLVHMSINRNAAQINRKTIGGPYVRKDIMDQLGIDPQSITTTDQLYELTKEIKAGDFVDDNGAPISILGPTAWGGSDRDFLYNDLVWSGDSGEKFWADEDGQVLHESMTDYGMERVGYVQKMMDEDLMNPEFYTMEETRAKEGIVNGSFAIVSDMHNYMPENNDLTYVPLGPLNRVDGTNNMIVSYKSGYAGWAVPSTTEHPEDIVKFADWLASEEGKMLYFYGLEGRDYDLDENGNPVVKQEVIDLKESNPDEAKKLGFRGVGAYWGEHLGYTDMDNVADFGESTWGESVVDVESNAPQQIIDMYEFDKRYEEAAIVDGLTPRSFLFEFEGDEGALATALDRYNEDLLRAYYANTAEEAEQILAESKQNLENAGLNDFCDFIEEKIAAGEQIKW